MAEAAAPEQRWAKRSGGGFKKLVAWLVILALAALALVLLSERNARSYTLEVVDGALVVKKGVLFPVGARSWVPVDPRLAPAYAPLTPPPGTALPEEQRFAGREELDQALFDLLARWARDDIASEQRDRLGRALGYLARGELLPGLSVSQRRDLEVLRAEGGFFEGRDLVGKAVDGIRQARERLERTARSQSSHASDAGEALRELEASLDALQRARRTLGAPATAGATTPASAPPPTSGEPPSPAGAAQVPAPPSPAPSAPPPAAAPRHDAPVPGASTGAPAGASAAPSGPAAAPAPPTPAATPTPAR